MASGAEGCGLLRTEFLFLDRDEAPDPAEQARQYQQVVDAFAGRPVVVRTLDAGSDKAIPFLAMPPQDNPALGLRGIRASLWRPDLLRTQIAAILAVRPAGQLPDPAADGQRGRRDPGRAAHDRGGRGRHRAAMRDIPLGIMIETPASAINAARLAAPRRFLFDRHERPDAIRARDRSHASAARGRSRRTASRGAATDRRRLHCRAGGRSRSCRLRRTGFGSARRTGSGRPRGRRTVRRFRRRFRR